MKISINWLQTYFEKEIPDAKKLDELFTFRAFEVEGVEDITDNDGKVIDSVLDVKVLPDRAHYALSHKGVAGEVHSMTGLPIKSRYVGEITSDIQDKPVIQIINDSKGSPFCRRYVGRIVDLSGSNSSGGNSPVAQNSPEWLVSALNSIGQRSINPLVDLTNYVMYDIGQPLHAFDVDKVQGKITIRAAKEGERIELLPERIVVDGKDTFKDRAFELSSNDYVIADDAGPLVIAGVKGGRRAEVTADTKRILIESANFDPTMVRRTSTKYDIRSDSSKRFENEISAELAIHGMNNISGLIKEVFPVAKFGPVVDEYPVKAVTTTIDFDPAYIEDRLGMKVPFEEVEKILAGMGIAIEKVSSNDWKLTIPFERLDLVIKDDIVEEVGRIYGYERIQGTLPAKTNNDPRPLPEFYIAEMVRNILVGEGYSEVSLYSLVEKGHVETLKPLAKDKAFARKDLVGGMISCVEKNALNADLLELSAIKVFEIGNAFSEDEGKYLETTVLCIGASQVKKVKGVKSDTLISQILESLKVGLKDVVDAKSFDVKPTMKNNVAVCEIDISKISNSLSSKVKDSLSYNDLDFAPISNNRYKKFSTYPFISRDIAVFVPESVSGEMVWETVSKGIQDAGALNILAHHYMFDVFKKDGKVSYAFRMIYQAMDKTLTDDEVNKIMDLVNREVKGKGWEVR